MKMKRIGSIALTALLILSMTLMGCSSKENKTATTNDGKQTSAPSNKPVKISIWSGYPELDSWMNKMAADYKVTNPNVSVEVVSFPLRDFEKKVATALPSNSCADIISLNPNLAMRYIKEHMLLKVPDDLSKFVTGGAYSPAVVNTTQYEGIVYGIPHMLGNASLYCNTKMFKEAGLTEAPKTMAQLEEYAKKLAKYDASGKLIRSGFSLRITGGGSGLAEKFWTLMMQNGGSIIEEVSPEKYRAGYDNDAGLKTLKMYIDMVYKNHTDDFNLLHDTEAFEAEKTAMFARETWVIGDIKTKAPNLEYFTAPMPGDSNIAITEDFSVTSSVKKENTEEVWNFIRFMMKAENHKQMTAMSGWQPGRLDLDMKDFFKENPQYEAFFTKYKNVNTTPMVPEFDEIETKFADSLANKGYTDKSFVDNTDKMKAFLKECAVETNRILKENGHLAE